MPGTLSTLGTLLAIRISSAANRLVFYAQKLPLIGRSIPDAVYANLNVKKAVTVVALLLSVVWGLASKLLYVGLLVYLPVAILGESLPQEERLRLFLHIFLLQSVFAAGITSATVLEPKRDKYIAVKLMRLEPGRYIRAALGYRYVTFFLYYIPALLVFGVPLGASVLQAVALATAVALWRIGCEYAHLKLFERTGTVLIRKNAVVWLTIGLAYALAYLPLLTDRAPVLGDVPLSAPALVVLAAAGVYGAVRLARYPDYRSAVDAASKRDDPLLNIGQMMTEAKKTDVRTKDRDLAMDPARTSGRAAAREGYAYLNEIFFARHRSLIREPVRKRLAIIAAASIVGVGFALFGGESAALLREDLGIVFPFLALIMNFLSIGERVCRAMFYNCDLSLLRYGFYRGAASRHFRIRLVRIAGLNLLIAAALGAALTLVVLTAGGAVDVRELLLLWVCVSALSVFFSVHHLFMYYFFQPYSTELNMKNPLFFLVNLLVSVACGLGIALRPSGPVFAAVVVALTVVYLGAALAIVRRHGSRRFRVK